MEKHYSYATEGVCSSRIDFDLVDGLIRNVKFLGGCPGNTQGVAALAEGMRAEEIVKRLRGIECHGGYSCPDQLARAVERSIAEN